MEWWKARPRWQKVTFGVVGAIVLIALFAPPAEEGEAEETTTTATTPITTTSTSTTSTTLAPTTTVEASVPWTPARFGVELIVVESECFNTAGALVTIEPELSIIGPLPEPDERMTVVYEIHGGESVQTFSIDVEGDSYSYDQETISTASCEDVLTAEVVRVLER